MPRVPAFVPPVHFVWSEAPDLSGISGPHASAAGHSEIGE